MQSEITSDEILYRAVSINPSFWKGERITSALFKDSKGVSVDRAGGRSSDSMLLNYIERMGNANVRALVYITAEDCTKAEAIVKAVPIEGNEHHAEIHKSFTEITLHPKQAKLLRDACTMILNTHLEE